MMWSRRNPQMNLELERKIMGCVFLTLGPRLDHGDQVRVIMNSCILTPVTRSHYRSSRRNCSLCPGIRKAARVPEQCFWNSSPVSNLHIRLPWIWRSHDVNLVTLITVAWFEYSVRWSFRGADRWTCGAEVLETWKLLWQNLTIS